MDASSPKLGSAFEPLRTISKRPEVKEAAVTAPKPFRGAHYMYMKFMCASDRSRGRYRRYMTGSGLLNLDHAYTNSEEE